MDEQGNALTELRGILRLHAAKYPLMRPEDAVKLLYQNEFGGGHLIPDPAASLARLRAEFASVPPGPAMSLAEDIGGGIVRVMLRALDPAVYPLETLNRDFVRSAALRRGDMATFLRKLEVLRALAAEGVFPAFSPAALAEYLAAYTAAGCPAVSHSGAYRAAYAPAYRVVLRALLPPAAGGGD